MLASYDDAPTAEGNGLTRGADAQLGSMCSYIFARGAGADGPSAACRSLASRRVLKRLSPRFRRVSVQLRTVRTALDRAGEAAPGLAAASDRQHPQRAAVDGATGLHHAVSLVLIPGTDARARSRLRGGRSR